MFLPGDLPMYGEETEPFLYYTIIPLKREFSSKAQREANCHSVKSTVQMIVLRNLKIFSGINKQPSCTSKKHHRL